MNKINYKTFNEEALKKDKAKIEKYKDFIYGRLHFDKNTINTFTATTGINNQP